MAWADANVWRAVPDLEAPPDDRLRMLLLHMHTVQHAFLQVWRNEPVTFRKAEDFPNLVSLREWAQPYYADVDVFIEGLDERRLGDPVTMPWVRHFEQRLGRGAEVPTLADTMFQVTSHSTHHRGQVNARLRELGVEPPLVDYIAWVWFGRTKGI
jgi:uncharacterized damage-inducible protein DinB